MLRHKQNAEIIIKIEIPNKNTLEEPNAEYMSKLERSVKEIEAGNGITFIMKEFEEYVSKNFPE